MLNFSHEIFESYGFYECDDYLWMEDKPESNDI